MRLKSWLGKRFIPSPPLGRNSCPADSCKLQADTHAITRLANGIKPQIFGAEVGRVPVTRDSLHYEMSVRHGLLKPQAADLDVSLLA